MILAIVILAVFSASAATTSIALAFRISKVRAEALEALAARQRAEAQLQLTSREFSDFRRQQEE